MLQTAEQSFEDQQTASNNLWHLGAGLALFIGLDFTQTDPEELGRLSRLKRYTFIPRQVAKEYGRRLRIVSSSVMDSIEQAFQQVNRHDPQKQLYEDTSRFRFYKAVGEVSSVLTSVVDLSFFDPNKTIVTPHRRAQESRVAKKVWGGTFIGNVIRCRTALLSEFDGSTPLAERAVPLNSPPRHIDDVLELGAQPVPSQTPHTTMSELGFLRGGMQSTRHIT